MGSDLRRLALVVLVPLLAAAPAHAANAPPAGVEVVMGATDVNATTGNGNLAAGISRDGDVTVLSWPHPGSYDQVDYLTRNGVGARDLHRMGALPSMGVFAGLVYDTSTSGRAITWFHDDPWVRTVTYTADDTTVVKTTFRRDDLDLTVTQDDFVPAGEDVLVRRYHVVKGPASPVVNASLMFYENLAPNLSRIPELPVTDFLLDRYDDFLGVWVPEDQAIYRFHPNDTGVITTAYAALNLPARDFGPLGALMKQPSIDPTQLASLRTDLDSSYKPGVYVAEATMPAADAFQVGGDTGDVCGQVGKWADTLDALAKQFPNANDLLGGAGSLARCPAGADPLGDVETREGWQWKPQDAYANALAGDPAGSPLAGAQVNTIQRVPLDLSSGSADASYLMAFGHTQAEARTALDAIRSQGPAAAQTAVETADKAYVASLDIPADLGPDVVTFSKRAFLNLRVGTDAGTGSMVASISRQPPYDLDWPRDGSFFDLALDLAGQHDQVTRHLAYYATVIRKQDVTPTPLVDQPVPGWPSCDSCDSYPKGSFDMNTYADGTVGGPVRFEIDNAALVVWSFAAHAPFMPATERATWLKNDAWPTVKLDADMLASWRDPATGLMWPANEDDNPEYTQGLQGAGTSFVALVEAARIAKAVGDTARMNTYAHRAAELKSAIMYYLYDDTNGFRSVPSTPGPCGRGVDWVVFPDHLLAFDDPVVQKMIARCLPPHLDRVLGKGAQGSYETKMPISAGLALSPGKLRDEAAEIPLRIARDIADPNAHFLGEVWINEDTNGDGVTDKQVNAVATPHLWSGILVYLAAMAVQHPDRFETETGVLPKVTLPDVLAPGVPPPKKTPPAKTPGCGCSAASSGGLSGAILALMLALWFANKRRRRSR